MNSEESGRTRNIGIRTRMASAQMTEVPPTSNLSCNHFAFAQRLAAVFFTSVTADSTASVTVTPPQQEPSSKKNLM